jgi:hypothetical protein
MRSNCTKPLRGTALLAFLPFLLAVSGAANADPLRVRQAAIGAESPATDTTGVVQRTWHWESDPGAYRPDGLSDYSEDFAADQQTTVNQDAASKANPLQTAKSQ